MLKAVKNYFNPVRPELVEGYEHTNELQ